MPVRAVLEGYATALASYSLGTAEYMQLRQINTSMEQALEDFDIATFNRFNRAFHATIYNCCPNTSLVELLQQTWDRLDTIRHSVFLFILERGRASVTEHAQLIGLLEQHASFE